MEDTIPRDLHCIGKEEETHQVNITVRIETIETKVDVGALEMLVVKLKRAFEDPVGFSHP